MSPTDKAAMDLWIGHRDTEAFRTLVQRHAGTVYATCNRILGNFTAAEDVTQECFEMLARTQATTQIHALGPWLHGMATKRSLLHIRSEGRRRRREASYVSEQETQTEIQWSDIYDRIDEAIVALPEDLRDPLVAHYLYGESHAAIARATSIPRRTVSGRIQRGVELVGASLKASGVTVPSVLLASLLASNLTQAVALPHGLATTLGKIALAGSGSPAATTTASAPMAAFLSMKGVALLAAAIAAVAAVTLFLSPDPTPGTLAIRPQRASNDTPPIERAPSIQAVDTALAALPVEPVMPTTTIDAQTTDEATPLAAAIDGTVTFHGEPVAGLFVGASPYVKADPVFNVTTDAQGYYRAEGLVPQELTIATMLFLTEGRPVTLAEMSNLGELDGPMTHDSAYTAKKRITLEADKTLRVDFELPGPTPDPPIKSALMGYVSVDGQIPEDAQISVQTADNRRTWTADVRSDGFYAAGPIPPGDYFVGLNVLRSSMEWWTRTAIFSDRVTTLDINADRSHTGAIGGSFRGVRDGEAANVVAFQGDVHIPSTYSATWLSEVDAPVAAGTRYQGARDAYLMKNLAPGTYTVVAVITSAYAHGVPHYGVLDYRTVEIAEEGEEATADFEFVSDDPPVIEGVLTGLHAEDNAWVKVYRGEFPMPVPFRESVPFFGSVAPSEFTATQFEAGRRRDIQIWNLEPGTYSLWASASADVVVGYTRTDGAIVTIAGLEVGYKKTDWTVVTIRKDQEEPVRVELAPVIQTHKATIRCRVLNLKPDRPEVLAYAVPGAPEVPLQATETYWAETHLQAATADRVLDSDALTLTGLDPGAYTVIAFHFPVRNTQEVRDATEISSEEFYAGTLIASAEVRIREAEEEIQLELAF